MKLAYRLLILGLAMTMTAVLVLGTLEIPWRVAHALVPTLDAWLHSLTPLQLALCKGVGYWFPGLVVVIAALAGGVRTARRPKPLAEHRWPPANRADPFGPRSGHGPYS